MTIDDPLWVTGAIVLCGAHTRYIRSWWRQYVVRAKQRPRQFLGGVS